ncbi:MAG: TetR/AcrR family transcriptional regulator [Alphaproteobacteria bacterium]|nr:TetR/AcrR family transcriptional regulator [Alphaproteobacteria bacterium]
MARTKANDYDEKRDAILLSAARLFAETGFDRASMSQLAETCGVSKALLYHYYSSKDALLFDVIGTHLNDLCARVEGADNRTLEPEMRLQSLVAALLNAYRAADHQHQVQINAMKYLPADQQEELKNLERRLVAVFADAIHAVEPALGDQRGLLKPITMSLFGMLNWHYMWFRSDGKIGRDDYAQIASRLVIDGARGVARA